MDLYFCICTDSKFVHLRVQDQLRLQSRVLELRQLLRMCCRLVHSIWDLGCIISDFVLTLKGFVRVWQGRTRILCVWSLRFWLQLSRTWARLARPFGGFAPHCRLFLIKLLEIKSTFLELKNAVCNWNSVRRSLARLANIFVACLLKKVGFLVSLPRLDLL